MISTLPAGKVSSPVTIPKTKWKPMASELEPLWEGGHSISGAAGDEKSEARSGTSRGRGGARAKKGQSGVLSSSFTCWKNTPDSCLNIKLKI